MKRLTKAAIIATCVSIPLLHSGSMSLVLLADPKNMHCVTVWRLPLVGTLSPRASEWWDCIYCLCIVAPPLLWLIVAARWIAGLAPSKKRVQVNLGFN